MKELKDYAHLYLGCKAILSSEDWEAPRKFTLNAYNLNYYRDYLSDMKLILRPLDAMRSDEEQEMKKTMDVVDFKGHKLQVDSGETFRFLLRSGFDLFGLHAAGLCVYENEVKG